MKNRNIYKTPEERTKAYIMERGFMPDDRNIIRNCFEWLEEKAEPPKLKPCSCGCAKIVIDVSDRGYNAYCQRCHLQSFHQPTKTSAILAWNSLYHS